VSFVFHLSFKDPTRDDTVPFSAEGQVMSGVPVRLKIPSIKVDASVEFVGVNSSGEMDVPKNPDNVAWFEPGVIPGDNGSAAIAGHFGWKEGIPAVFDDLNKLKKGDKVYVEDEKGVTVVFVVRELKVYKEGEESSRVFISNDGKAHLNLITCGGVWNKADESYSDRLVVFTDKE
jgi:LPXTG-site transpeptidase (sortase) family protein